MTSSGPREASEGRDQERLTGNEPFRVHMVGLCDGVYQGPRVLAAPRPPSDRPERISRANHVPMRAPPLGPCPRTGGHRQEHQSRDQYSGDPAVPNVCSPHNPDYAERTFDVKLEQVFDSVPERC